MNKQTTQPKPELGDPVGPETVEYTSEPDPSLTEPFEAERTTISDPSSPPRTYVYYHRADFDGLASAAVTWHYLKTRNIEPILVGWDYDDPEPILPGKDDLVFIVDLSIPCLMDHQHLIWIDHHKSAIEQWGERPGRQLSGVAACRLAWNYFFSPLPGQLEDFVDRKVKEPKILRLLGEYDVFDLREVEILNFQYGAQSYYPLDPSQQIWSIKRIMDMFSDTTPTLNFIDVLCRAGDNIHEWITKAARKGAQHGQVIELSGHKFWCINNPIGGSHWAPIPTDHVFECEGIMKYAISNGEARVSFYQNPHLKEGPDMSVIARQYGGGGHKGAAGCKMSLRELGALLGWDL